MTFAMTKAIDFMMGLVRMLSFWRWSVGGLLLLWVLMACNKTEPASSSRSEVNEDVTALPESSIMKASSVHASLTEEALTKDSAQDNTRPVFDREAVKAQYKGKALRVLDVSERKYQGRNALAVTLSVPLDPEKYHDNYFVVYLNETGESIEDSGWVLSKNGKILYFPEVEPNTAYRVEVLKGLTAVNGERHQGGTSELVKTRHVAPRAVFANRGHFLPLSALDPTGLPVSSVNIPEVNIDFYRVSDGNLHHFLHQVSGHQKAFYRYYYDRIKPYVSLVYSGRYALDALKNQQKTHTIPVSENDALSAPGVYVAIMTPPGEHAGKFQMTYFAVTDIGMHIRLYRDQMDVYVSNLATADPESDVEISWFDHEGKLVAEAQSAASGLASLSLLRRKLNGYVLAQKGRSTALVRLTGPALDLSEFQVGQRPYRDAEIFMYSPRDIYRPGEEVIVSALLRDQDGRRVRLPNLPVQIRAPNGQVLKRLTWRPEAEGYYESRYILPKEAKTGDWQFRVKNIDGEWVTYAFKVEEFLPERMKLSFDQTAAKQVYAPQTDIILPVLGEYLYGAPAAGNRLQARFSTSLYRQPFDQLPQYYFGDVKDTSLKQTYDLGNFTLDSRGELDLSLKSRWQSSKSPLRLKVNTQLYETGGRPISRVQNLAVLPKRLFGVRSELGESNPEANSRVNFDVISVNDSGSLVEAKDVEIRLIREDRQYFWEYNDHRGWHYDFTEKEYVAETETIDIGVKDPAQVAFDVEWGWYRFEVEDVSTGVRSSLRFHAGADWYRRWRENQNVGQSSRPDKIQLALDKAHYAPGDVAKLNIVPPNAGRAWVIVESDKRLFSKYLDIPEGGATIDIPVQADWRRHDIYVSVVMLQGSTLRSEHTPKRALGLIHLPLDREARRLNVTLLENEALENEALENEALESPKIFPNSVYTARISVANASVGTFVTLAAVDVGALAVTGFETPDPFRFFFEPRRYQIDSRDMYQKLIEPAGDSVARQRFGGDRQLKRGGKHAQADVNIVSIFSGPVALDDQGEADITLDIPDFNGRIRLMALAFNGDQVGHAEAEVTVAAPLVTQIAMPRFVALGDQTTFALDVHNLTNDALSLSVDLAAIGPLDIVEPQRKLSLAASEKRTLRYSAVMGNENQDVMVELKVSGVPDYPIQRQWRLNTRPAFPALTFRKQVALTPGETFSHDFQDVLGLSSAPWRQSSLEAVVNLSHTPPLNARQHMQRLLKYPYGCLEQTTSSTYPWLYATDAVQSRLSIKNTTGRSRELHVQAGIERLAAKQLANGGLGYWNQRSRESVWGTVYAADFLADAKDAGFAVDGAFYEAVMKRVAYYFRRDIPRRLLPWSEQKTHYEVAVRAYAAYVLSRHNRASLSKLRKLVEHDIEEAKSFLPYIHLGLALANQGDGKTGADVLKRGITEPRSDHYLADYGSFERDGAMAVRLLTRYASKLDSLSLSHDLEPYTLNLLRRLSGKIKDRTYLSTQERNQLFLAAMALDERVGSGWRAELTLLNATESIQRSFPFSRWMEYPDLKKGLEVKNTHSSPIFLTLDYQGVGVVAPPPESNGYTIKRDYFDQYGQPLDMDTLHVGDLVLVRLKVSSDKRSPETLVVDLLPAGLELENQNLKHSATLDDVQIEGKKLADWRLDAGSILHQEYRDDRFVAAINLRNFAQLFYLARVVTPGVYKVPPPVVEDMYEPEKRAVGSTLSKMTIQAQKIPATP